MKIFKNLFEQTCEKLSLGEYFTMRLPNGDKVRVTYSEFREYDYDDELVEWYDRVGVEIRTSTGGYVFSEHLPTREDSLFDNAWGLVREATGCKI